MPCFFVKEELEHCTDGTRMAQEEKGIGFLEV